MRGFRVLATILTLGLAFLLGAADAPLNNDDVVKLVKLGLGDEVVLAKIRQAPSVAFQLETEDLANLKAAGVSSAIMEAMLLRAAPPPPPARTAAPPNELEAAYAQATGQQVAGGSAAVVWLIDGEQRKRMRTTTGDFRTAGLGMKMVNPFAKIRAMRTFNGNHAQLRVSSSSPQFEITMSADMNPADAILLAKLKTTPDKREISVASGRLGMSSGISKEDSVPIRITEGASDSAGSVTHRVGLLAPLEPGEYALVFMGAIFYDFGVDITQ